MDRRRFLSASGAGLAGLAGCSDRPPAESTSTVSHASANRSTRSSNARPVVFDGGELAAFVGALREAANSASGTLAVSPGIYRFDPLRSAAERHQRHAQIPDLAGVTVEGQGATLVFTDPRYGGFQFAGGRDLALRDLTFDYDPVPFTQGTMTSLADGKRTVTLHLDDGYPALDRELFRTADNVWATIHRPDGSFVSGHRGDVTLKFGAISRTGDRTYRLRLAEHASTTGLATGLKLTVLARNPRATLDFHAVDGLTVENVEIHAGPGGGFATGLCTDPAYVGCSVRPPAGSTRHVGANADGIRVVDCRSSATVRDCHVEAIEDDGIVVQWSRTPVVEVRGPKTVAVTKWPVVATPGDVFDVVSQTGVRKGRLPPVESMTAMGQTPGERSPAETLTFAEPVADRLAVGDLLGNRTMASRNFVVRNNVVRNLRGHCVLITAADGTVADNVLDGASHNTVELACDTVGHFIPQGPVTNVTVRDNRLSRSGLNWMAQDHPAAIRVHHRQKPDLEAVGRPNENVTIAGNEVTSAAAVGVELADAAHLSVEGNTLRGLNRLDYPHGGYGFRLSNVSDVSVTGNRVAGTADALEAFGVQVDSERVTDSGNRFVLDGTDSPAVLRQWVPVRFEFDRTVRPSGGDLYLAFRCQTLRLLAGDGTVVETVDVGSGNEDGVRFGTGVYKREGDGSTSWRWFGGKDRRATVSFPRQALSAATTLELEGVAFRPGISARVVVDGHDAGSLHFSAESVRRYRVTLP